MEKEDKQNSQDEKIEESTLKSGVDKLKEIGLKEVSNKTFINFDNLNALLDKDFSKLNKTKALGFIQILQREFDVDLNELKNEYLQFNKTARTSKLAAMEEPVTKVYTEEEPKKLLPYLLLGLGALLGGYLLFSGGGTSESVTSMDLNVVKNEVLTQEGKETLLALDEKYENEVNESDEVDLNKVVEEMFRHNQDNNESIMLEENETNSTTILDTNVSAVITPAVEENVQLEKSDALETLEKSAPLVVPVKEVKKPKKIENSNRGGLFIKPIQKAWVGVIFLDTMKKKDFLIRNMLQLDAGKDQIILIGHKNFKIFNKQLEQGFKSKKMVRFLYKDGDLREISKREYQQHAGGVRW